MADKRDGGMRGRPAYATRLSRQCGFSLLEVLVAFTIMALALGALYQLSGSSMGNTAYLEKRTYAIIMAESLLARYNRIPPAGVHESGGNPGGFQWQLNSAPFEWQRQLESDGDAWLFHRLESRVYWRELGRTREVVLTTLLPESSGE